jgi:hypothetical protein
MDILGFKKFKELGYTQSRLYRYYYKFGKPNLEGKLLYTMQSLVRENNIFVEEGFCRFSCPKLIRWYNERDALIKRICYNQEGSITCVGLREYNNSGLLIKDSHYSNQNDPLNIPQGHPSFVETFEYGDNGLISKRELWHYSCEGKKGCGNVEKYNDKGLPVEVLYYFDDGHFYNKEEILYDDKNLKKEEYYYYNTGKLSKRIEYKYNDSGAKVDELFYDLDLNTRKRDVIKYNDSGKKIEYVSYNSNSDITHRWTYEYNDRGLVTEIAFYSSEDKIIWGYWHKYNDKDVLVEETRFGSLREPIDTSICEYK